MVPLTIIDDPSDRTADSLAGKEGEYTYQLNEEVVKEIIASTNKIKARIPAIDEAVKKVPTPSDPLPGAFFWVAASFFLPWCQ